VEHGVREVLEGNRIEKLKDKFGGWVMKFGKLDRNAVQESYLLAKKAYAGFGVDTDAVIAQMKDFNLSLHCWQGDDSISSGGLMATGNFPGKSKTPAQLRADIEAVIKQMPSKKSVNIHAMYSESTDGSPVGRNDITTAHFQNWVDWANKLDIGIDFNHTFFGHEMSKSGYTLSSPDETVRAFWVKHAKLCREIANWIGEQTGKTCANNLWIPDGSKEVPVNRSLYREQLKKSLDEIFAIKYDPKNTIDSLESKLFGIGAESFTSGSHEFYMGYAVKNNIAMTLDMGHFHQTESVPDKLSSIFLYLDKVVFHISRGVRWDSDHAPVLGDEVLALLQEVKRCNAFDKAVVGLDFFDPSVNRLLAWATSSRAVQKAAMIAMLEPTAMLKELEIKGQLGERLAILDELKSMPFAAVWDKLCVESGVAPGHEWIDEINAYTDVTIAQRS